jgi:hypothetical protein
MGSCCVRWQEFGRFINRSGAAVYLIGACHSLPAYLCMRGDCNTTAFWSFTAFSPSNTRKLPLLLGSKHNSWPPSLAPCRAAINHLAQIKMYLTTSEAPSLVMRRHSVPGLLTGIRSALMTCCPCHERLVLKQCRPSVPDCALGNRSPMRQPHAKMCTSAPQLCAQSFQAAAPAPRA